MADRTPDPKASGSWERASAGDASASPRASASGTSANRIGVEPLTVRIELVVAAGPAAEELLNRQAAVICQALQWFAEHRRSEYGQESGLRADPAMASGSTVGRPATSTPDEGERTA